jgi:ubiquinone/menaquinone biosynthesis C-methylase UbiE
LRRRFGVAGLPAGSGMGSRPGAVVTFSDITPVALRTKFVRSAMLSEQRSRQVISHVDDYIARRAVPVQRVLEIGSGTGNFLAVASERYSRVIGIDIAMRWLHVSRRRFMDKGLAVPPLVCCCAEYLPFADGQFDLIVSHSTLEFTRDQGRVLSECSRSLSKSGFAYINTVNRYSLARDPYAYLWGVGFLPRDWQAGYVRWRRNAAYEQIRLLSLGELDRLANEYFSVREFLLPDVDDKSLAEFSVWVRLQVELYRALKKLPGIKRALKRFGPGWNAVLSQPYSSKTEAA